jgi:hypothetical protein
MTEQISTSGVASEGDDFAQLEAAIPARQFWRLLPEEVRAAQRERWERTPDHVWLSRWLPLPEWVPRGPYARPTRALIRDVEAGLRRLTGEQ